MQSGRSFLQLPGPTNVPDRILRAMDRPLVDHRGPEFAELTHSILPLLQEVFGTTEGAVVLYPGSGTAACEAALVNVLAPDDRVLVFNNGVFGGAFSQVARNLGFGVDEVLVDWGAAVTGDLVEQRLRAEHGGSYQAVLVVHNETSTGVTSPVAEVRAALDRAGTDALLLVDAVSSLASMPFGMDEWGVDVAFCGSQKGLMLPPGLGLLCAGARALARAENGGSPRHYFDWRPILRENAVGFFPVTPATLLLFGLSEALDMFAEEGLPAVFERHRLLADGVRAAVRAWGLDELCQEPRYASNTVTVVQSPDGVGSEVILREARERYGLILGSGLGKLRGQVFRIGHLGALNQLEVLATLGGIEMTLAACGVPVTLGSGVAACQASFLRGTAKAENLLVRAGGR